MSLILACAMLLAVDGDSVKCDGGPSMRDMGPGEPFKSGYDTPEIFSPQCDRERELGLKAKARMQELLDQPGTYVVDSGLREFQYDRPLVWVKLAGGETAGEVLMREGYAVPWPNDVDWCSYAW